MPSLSASIKQEILNWLETLSAYIINHTIIDAAVLSCLLWWILSKLASLFACIALVWPHNPVFIPCIPTDAEGAESTLAKAGW